MKASKLAEALRAHVEEHGDVDVAIEYDSAAGGWLDVEDDEPIFVAEYDGLPLALINLGEAINP